jgi:tetratricopeptide (TPR) repeat protein
VFDLRGYKNYSWIIIICLIAAALAAFGRIAGNEFINFDDNIYITANNHIKAGINLENIKWAFSTFASSNWHPLTWLSHMLDWSLFGANASGHHLINLFLHIGAVLFLFLFLNKTTNNIWPSAFAAALFALHPLRVESVAWAAERKDVLSMFFGMASIYVYAFYAESSKLSRYLLCLTLFALSLMAKSMLVTLPFILLLLDYWPLKRWQKDIPAPPGNSTGITGRLLWEKVPFIILTIVSSIMTVWAQYQDGSAYMPFPSRLFNAIISYASYLRKIFLPVDLAVFYPFQYSFSIWQVLISCLILIGITFVVIHFFRKLPFLFVGWFWYLGTLIPVSGLVPVNVPMADHFTYLPSIGIAVMLAWGIPYWIRSENIRKKILFPAATAALAVLAVLTWQQCGYWKNSIELFSHALHVTHNNYLAHNNMGCALADEGKINEALDHYNEAIRILPSYANAYNNRGNIYTGRGQYQRALEDFNESIRLKPAYASTYNNRGNVYAQLGQYQPAIEDFSKAISLQEDCFEAYCNRGRAYGKMGQYQLAIENYNKAITLKPDDAYPYINVGIFYFKQGNDKPGCYAAQKACELGSCKLLELAKKKGSCR